MLAFFFIPDFTRFELTFFNHQTDKKDKFAKSIEVVGDFFPMISVVSLEVFTHRQQISTEQKSGCYFIALASNFAEAKRRTARPNY